MTQPREPCQGGFAGRSWRPGGPPHRVMVGKSSTHRRRFPVSRAIFVASVLLLCLALPAPAQQATPKPKAPPGDKDRDVNVDAQQAKKPRADVKVERLVYAVRGGSAKDLANALSAAFGNDASFQVFPSAASNSLVL